MRSEDKKQNILRVITIILAIVFFISAALFVLDLWEKRQGVYTGSQWNATDETFVLNGTEYEKKSNLKTYLVMGLDTYEGTNEPESYNNDRQADFIVLMVLDDQDKTCSLLQINRDTMTEMNILGVAGDKIGTVTKQIALAHTYGNGKEVSCRNTANAVSKLLGGISVDHYLSVTLDAVGTFADLVDGVEVTVLDDFGEIDKTLIKGQSVTLRGEHALHYVRSRYGLEDSSNESRMARQRQFLEALYKKTHLCMEQDEAFASKTGLKMSEYIVSDQTVNQLEDLLAKIATYELNKIYTFDGETTVGETHIEFYPDKTSVQQIAAELFYQPKQ